ncbi:alpha/beta family hydrolase [Alteromonas sp. ASW11-130]|uniref:alpha/beta family hydrolase n=1 Tax=Alteromonas sp. ASW11-130 TaxID=3015775 RepID=UPI002241E2E2|nr:alpha/beta family hydrolase [Alteromonas sp. ASW11-130]MCW8090664.1 dienelactone hydrolase family protein [Alteromonas sp. ASW11-130]
MSYSVEVKKANRSAFARAIIAHGAGAGKSSDFIQQVAIGLSESDVEVVLFDFPYMQIIEHTGKRRPPDRMPKSEAHFQDIILHIKQQYSPLPTFIGGKSMGGRVSTLIADDVDIEGGIVYGYPFHPPGKPEKTRTEHLKTLSTPYLILQGERDPFGTAHEIQDYSLSTSIQIDFMPNGEHSFKPLKASGLSQQDNINSAIDKTVQFIKTRCS